MVLTEVEIVAGALLFIVAIVSLYCSIMLLYIIHRLNKWNGYLVLIYSMTVCQVLYDITFFFLIFYQNPTVFKLLSASFTFGGLSVTFWSNVLSGVLLYLVISYTPLKIWNYYWIFFWGCTLSAGIYAVFDGIYCEQEYMAKIYNLIRFLSILFNFVVYFAINQKLRMLRLTNRSRAIGPLRVLASRFKYYPIAQIICRLPTTAYQLKYGFNFTTFHTVTFHDTAQVSALMIYALTAASGGIAFFLIFLVMQPQANVMLKRIRIERYNALLACCPTWLCCCCGGPISDYDSVSMEEESEDTRTGGGRSVLDRNNSGGHSSNFLGGAGDRRGSTNSKENTGINTRRNMGLETPGVGTGGRYASDSINSADDDNSNDNHVANNNINNNKITTTSTNPMPLHRSFSETEIEVGGVFIQADDWRHYRNMDEDELDANISSLGSSAQTLLDG